MARLSTDDISRYVEDDPLYGWVATPMEDADILLAYNLPVAILIDAKHAMTRRWVADALDLCKKLELPYNHIRTFDPATVLASQPKEEAK